MAEVLPWLILAAIAIATALLLAAVRKSRGSAVDVRAEIRSGREEARSAGKELREEVSHNLKAATDSLNDALERIRFTLDSRVKELQDGNERKLDEMRKTVDEKLDATLEKRLGESFKFVGDRLEAVHKGLGEMQALAAGVGDLKRVLSNVKVRGSWAEVVLGDILADILAPGQYEKNVHVNTGSAEVVEYAIRLPGPRDDPDAHVWLAIDSKFPQEDYTRLQHAAEAGDPDGIQRATEGLMRAVRVAAKDVRDKYVSPPETTDFAIMYLATEGLYAEVLRQPNAVIELRQKYHVVVAGPATIAAILSSLRLGFQTLAIEQRSAEVWRLLGAVKTEFRKFGEVLAKVKRQLDAASNTIRETDVRTSAIRRKLNAIEGLPDAEAARMLGAPPDDAPLGDGGAESGAAADG